MKKLFGVSLRKAEDRTSGGPARAQSTSVIGSKKETELSRGSAAAEAPPATASSPTQTR